MPFVADYLASVSQLIERIPTEKVDRLVELLEAAWRDRRHVLLMGNGGSGATASHIVNDMQKCIQLDSGKALRALCLSDSTPLLTAWANDTDFANVFAPQVECWAEPGDLVIGISGSGNSENVIRAMEAARARGAHTFALTGFDGGRLAQISLDCIIIPSDSMQQIEDLHMVVLHVVFAALRERVRR